MKPITIHPFSAFIGASVLALVAVAVGAAQVPPLLRTQPVNIVGPVETVAIESTEEIVLDGPILGTTVQYIVPPDSWVSLTEITYQFWGGPQYNVGGVWTRVGLEFRVNGEITLDADVALNAITSGQVSSDAFRLYPGTVIEMERMPITSPGVEAPFDYPIHLHFLLRGI